MAQSRGKEKCVGVGVGCVWFGVGGGGFFCWVVVEEGSLEGLGGTSYLGRSKGSLGKGS